MIDTPLVALPLALVAGIVFLCVRVYRRQRERELLSKRAYNTVLAAAQERGERAEDAEARVRVVEHALWVAQTSGHSIANELTAERARAAEAEHGLRMAWDSRDAARAVVIRAYLGASWSAMFHASVWLTHSFPGGTLNTHLARWRSHEQFAEALLLELASLGNPTAEALVEAAAEQDMTRRVAWELILTGVSLDTDGMRIERENGAWVAKKAVEHVKEGGAA